jgi:hypothetical protein
MGGFLVPVVTSTGRAQFGGAIMKRLLVVGLVLSLAQAASADMVISEWMYSGSDEEFIEFTNTGASSVDMSGWSFDNLKSMVFFFVNITP